MRLYNERLILSLARRFGPLSKIEVARMTGLSVQSTSTIMNRLQIDGLLNTFGEGQPGQLVAILDSAGQVSVCVVNGSAARRLNAAAGEAVELSWQVGPV